MEPRRAQPVLTHRAVPKHAHEVVEVSFGSRSQVQVLQPLLHRESSGFVSRTLASRRTTHPYFGLLGVVWLWPLGWGFGFVPCAGRAGWFKISLKFGIAPECTSGFACGF